MRQTRGKTLILAGSPRAGGNSDTAVAWMARGIREAGGTVEIIALRDWRIQACTACGACAVEGRCILEAHDDVERLFQRMEAAERLVFASPVFFYGLPARFKAFVDRAQSRWVGCAQGKIMPPKAGLALLVAARTQGEKLFSGCLLTLRSFASVLGISVLQEYCLRGYDASGALFQDSAACQRLLEEGKRFGQAREE